MKYLVIELQTATDGSVANIVTAYDNRNEAESAYHAILSAAAVSTLPCHAAMIVTNDAHVIAGSRYTHGVEPVPEE